MSETARRFYLEELCVALALLWACAWSPRANIVFLWVAVPFAVASLRVWRGQKHGVWASFVVLGAVLGFSSYGLSQLAFLALAARRGAHWLWLLAGGITTAAPLLLVSAALHATGWQVESDFALHAASALSLAFYASDWALRWFDPKTVRGFAPLVAIALSVTVVFTAGVVRGPSPILPAGPAVPAYRHLSDATGPTERLEHLLRRRVAGDRNAGLEAAAHWLEAFDADADTLRFVCPKFGWLPHQGNEAAISVGRAACDAIRSPPEAALERLSEVPKLGTLRSEIEHGLGRRSADAPLWIRWAYGLASMRPENWAEWNARLDFRTPQPAKTRGLRGHGPGRLLVAPVQDLGGFALTALTKRGGLGFYVDAEAPKGGEQPTRLALTGVLRRGLRVELHQEGGAVFSWGCGLGASDTQAPMDNQFCDGAPGTVVLDLKSRLRAPIRKIRLRGELAIHRIEAS